MCLTSYQLSLSRSLSLTKQIPAELITLDVNQVNRIGVGGPGEEEEKLPTSQKGREKWKARGKSGVAKQVQKKQEAKEKGRKVEYSIYSSSSQSFFY